MAAVIAAIAAAFLAGGVALFREHRLQQRRLLVAARITYDTLTLSRMAIETASETDRWEAIDALPGKEAFSEAWSSSKEALAGHLLWDEWRKVERAISSFLLVLVGAAANKTPKERKTELDTSVRLIANGRRALYPYCTERLSIWKLIRRKAQRTGIKPGSSPA
jgi:hypothetical protein